MDRMGLEKKARKRILITGVIGIVLILTDFAVSAANRGIDLVQTEQGIYMVRPEKGAEVGHGAFRVTIKGKNNTFEKKVSIALDPYGAKKETKKKTHSEETGEEERIGQELRSIISGFNDDSKNRQVLLPAKLKSGESIYWEQQADRNTVPILAVCILIMAALYKNRFRALEKRKQQERESVIRQLPEFVNRLVLLLNAGLVLSTAFERSVEESMELSDTKDDYFYGKLREIYVNVKTVNGSMHRELREFARKSGIKELIRVANIICDNVSKGTGLTEKLQAESEILWMNRKKNCEERGRLAETKLTLPLVIFLLVLIVITIAPALLEL